MWSLQFPCVTCTGIYIAPYRVYINVYMHPKWLPELKISIPLFGFPLKAFDSPLEAIQGTHYSWWEENDHMILSRFPSLFSPESWLSACIGSPFHPYNGSISIAIPIAIPMKQLLQICALKLLLYFNMNFNSWLLCSRFHAVEYADIALNSNCSYYAPLHTHMPKYWELSLLCHFPIELYMTVCFASCSLPNKPSVSLQSFALYPVNTLVGSQCKMLDRGQSDCYSPCFILTVIPSQEELSSYVVVAKFNWASFECLIARGCYEYWLFVIDVM